MLFIDGEVFGVLMFSLAGLFWFLVPLWDRKTAAGNKGYWLTYAGIFVVIYIIVFTIIGFIT
jgi:quinol-cytochrome oxidoreductase complex cytochrome b subunit